MEWILGVFSTRLFFSPLFVMIFQIRLPFNFENRLSRVLGPLYFSAILYNIKIVLKTRKTLEFSNFLVNGFKHVLDNKEQGFMLRLGFHWYLYHCKKLKTNSGVATVVIAMNPKTLRHQLE